MIDWNRPLKQVPRPDVDGGSYGPVCHLQAMLDDEGVYMPLSASPVDRDTRAHFAQQFRQGVRFMVVAEGAGSKPIYYRADGTPWLTHHAALTNRNGPPMALADRHAKAVAELNNVEAHRKRALDLGREKRRRADTDYAAAQRIVEQRQRDEIEAHPLWGTF